MIKKYKQIIEVVGASEFVNFHMRVSDIVYIMKKFNLNCALYDLVECLVKQDLTDEEIILLILDNRKENYILYYVDKYDLFIIMELN